MNGRLVACLVARLVSDLKRIELHFGGLWSFLVAARPWYYFGSTGSSRVFKQAIGHSCADKRTVLGRLARFWGSSSGALISPVAAFGGLVPPL